MFSWGENLTPLLNLFCNFGWGGGYYRLYLLLGFGGYAQHTCVLCIYYNIHNTHHVTCEDHLDI